jgi:four helix bundle protein
MPANFAEGFKKVSLSDKLRFYNIARGSLEECRYYLILAKDLNYGDVTNLSSRLEQISKMLDSYMRSIRNAK